jgi:tetratricopeptide (TPR) repeat protein
MLGTITPEEEAQLMQTIEMFEVITQSQPSDYQSLEILKEAYFKLGRHKDVIGASKRIAHAYMQIGQLSSAILEYETILQRYPEDPDVLAALAEIESKANSLTSVSEEDSETVAALDTTITKKKVSRGEVEDGRQQMYKILVEGKLVAEADFNIFWPIPSLTEPPGRVIEPLLFSLQEKAICPADKSLKMLIEKTRLGYLPIDKYDIDVELARSFPKDVCQRWCVLPFDRMSKSILVATVNPFNQQAAEELQQSTPYRLLWYLANPVDLMRTVKKIYR